jgi:hypothetical protein
LARSSGFADEMARPEGAALRLVLANAIIIWCLEQSSRRLGRQMSTG